jgi:GNAT superfamily N-acetyltransferase
LIRENAERAGVTLISAASPEWDAWLQLAPHDVYHTAGFHRHAHVSNEGEPFLAVVGSRERGLAWPYLLRHVADIDGLESEGATDVNSVYGYPGPIAWGCEPGDPFLTSAFDAVVGVWREQGAVAAFTRFHPLLGNAALLSGLAVPTPGTDGSGGVVAGGHTVSVDLSQGIDAARAGYAKDLSRDIRALRRLGMVTVRDEGWEHLSTFATLYRETMVRSRARQYYFFNEDHFRGLRDALDGNLHLFVTLADGEVAAGALFTEFDGIVEWYLVGTAAAYRQLSPSKLLLDDAVAWAAGRGASVLHLGGGRGGREDTLLWYKGRFAQRRHAFHTGRWVLDRQAHDHLVQRRQQLLAPAEILEAGYFPAYRAPVAYHPDHDAPTSVPVRPLEIRAVTSREAPALRQLLPRIDTTYFRPHPMTVEQADHIASLHGRDVYLIGLVGEEPVAYGMLRGWDEGFDVPSLGIGVRRDFERQGYGRAMMRRLHEVAIANGARQVRLRVHADNIGAASLYRELGYQEVGVERSEILMLLDL